MLDYNDGEAYISNVFEKMINNNEIVIGSMVNNEDFNDVLVIISCFTVIFCSSWIENNFTVSEPATTSITRNLNIPKSLTAAHDSAP